MSSPGRLDILGDVLDAIDAIYKEQAKMWQDTAALRDELHESNVMTSEAIGALANRIEGVTRTLTLHHGALTRLEDRSPFTDSDAA